MSFCTNCGARSSDGTAFCSNCGKPLALPSGSIDVPNSPAPQVGATGSPALVTPAVASPTRTAPAPWGKILAIVIVLCVLLVGAIVGSMVYVGYRVKSKVDEVRRSASDRGERASSSDATRSTSPNGGDSRPDSTGQNAQDNPLAGVLGAIGGGGGQTTPMGNLAKGILEDVGATNPDMPPDMIRNIPYSALKTPLPCPAGGGQINVGGMAAGQIQLKPGTVLTTSWSVPAGDVESTQQISSVSPENLDFQFSGITRPRVGETGTLGHADLANRVCGKDIAGGESFSTGWVFSSDDTAPGLYPGLSRILLPVGKFQTLKTSGTLPMVFGYYDYMDALTEWELLAWKGTLKRVEAGDVPFPLIINDEAVDVPAIHVQGSMKVIETGGRFGTRDQPTDAYILDDPNTPVVLSWMFGEDLKQDDAFRVRYIRVTYPGANKPTIEQKLAKDKRAVTYGIHFDFNKDTIRPDSEPILKEIVQAMNDNPDWKLTVEGHTDNIGGDAPNLDLSKRRAAAVKQALVNRYHIAPDRLVTSGYGRSRPVDTNETLEGRARNRRVELSRE